MEMWVLKSQRGFVLISALVLLLSITLIAVTVAYRNTLDEMMAANQRDYINAVGVAESGIEAGFAKVKHNVGGTYVDLVAQVWGTSITSLAVGESSLFLSGSVSNGSYSVNVKPVGTPMSAVLMTSTGLVNGAERVVEVVMEMKPTGSPQYAILVSKDLDKISGDPVISGPNADLHTNRDMWISGNPIVAGAVTASGQVREGAGEPGVVEGVSGGAALVPIPHIYPPTYKPYRTHLFTKDCLVRDAAGGLIADLRNGSKWKGWDCASNDKWVMSSSTSSEMQDGIFYVEGNVEIGGSPETSIWYASIIAEGYIMVSGNPWIRPYGSKAGVDTGNAIANEILFYAGGDLKLNGNASSINGSQIFYGLMATHMELDVSGNGRYEGTMIAENGAAQEVTTGQVAKNMVDKNSISGNMTLNSRSSAIFSNGKKLTVTAWRELVN